MTVAARTIVAIAVAVALLSAIGLAAPRVYAPAMCKIYG